MVPRASGVWSHSYGRLPYLSCFSQLDPFEGTKNGEGRGQWGCAHVSGKLSGHGLCDLSPV